MKRILLTFLAVCVAVVSLGLVGCGGSKQEAGLSAKADSSPKKQETVGDLFAKGKNLPGMSCDFVMTAEEFNITGKMWIAGKNMKSEMIMDNDKLITIFDADANVVYTYNPAQNTATKVPLSDDLKTVPTPDRLADDVDVAKVKVLETTTYDGAKCKVLLIKDNTSKAETKLWVRDDYGIPVRVEAIDSDGGKTVMEYKNLQVGAQPAETFRLPAGVKVTDMAEVIKNLPKQ